MSIYVVKNNGKEKVVREMLSNRRVNDWEEAIVLYRNQESMEKNPPKKTQKNEAQPAVVARE